VEAAADVTTGGAQSGLAVSVTQVVMADAAEL